MTLYLEPLSSISIFFLDHDIILFPFFLPYSLSSPFSLHYYSILPCALSVVESNAGTEGEKEIIGGARVHVIDSGVPLPDWMYSMHVLLARPDGVGLDACLMSTGCRKEYAGGEAQLMEDKVAASIRISVRFMEGMENEGDRMLCDFLEKRLGALIAGFCKMPAKIPSFWDRFNVTSPSLIMPASKFALSRGFSPHLNSIGKNAAELKFRVFRKLVDIFSFEAIALVLGIDQSIFKLENLLQLQISLKLEHVETSALYLLPLLALSDFDKSKLQPILVKDLERVAIFPDATIVRTLELEGFHRNLVSKIVLHRRSCSLLIIESFSDSVYVDTFELQEIARFGGATTSAGDFVDIEKPTSHANQLVVSTLLPLQNEAYCF